MARKKKIREKQKKNLMVLGIVALSILAITIGYAALSSTLNITFNKVTQNAIGFGPVFNGAANSTISATAGGTSSTGRSCGTATISSDRMSITVGDTVLSKPDDSCTWTVAVKNEKEITAKFSSVTATAPSSTTCTNTNNNMQMQCGNITYYLATNTGGTTFYSLNSTLAKNATQTFYLIAKYTGTTVNSSAVIQSGAKFTLNWAQA